MGRQIRDAGLDTVVGRLTVDGTIDASYYASACVEILAGGVHRTAVVGSKIGVHRFATTSPQSDPVAETQRTTGRLIAYFTEMGISPEIVAMMTEVDSRDVLWVDDGKASALALTTPRR